LEITKGYVLNYDNVLGHEFVGLVVESDDSTLIGQRVVAEINCPCEPCPSELCPDGQNQKAFARNHTPRRTVLGIINMDGCMAQYCKVPSKNLHVVPDDVTDQEAAFTEPLAAAYRIVEQEIVSRSHSVAVVGDGKLGLLIAHVLSTTGHRVTFFGRHERKLNLVDGVADRIVVDDTTSEKYASKFDVVIEASGSPAGILLTAALTKPMGTIVLKSTCSTASDKDMPSWSAIANDIVVNEKRLFGSRCGPMGPALELLRDPSTKRLVNSMVDAVYNIDDGIEAFEKARQKGSLKVQIAFE
jgi:threonine dehydrogenase-like Zn-dependent dehydrogenase